MLSYALAIAVATSSLVLFLTAFLMSDIHRKDDFLWSGVGLIYALVLWYCARNITGAVLLGQAAATALLVSYSWQTLKLRRAIANPDKAAEINNFSVLQKIDSLFKRKKPTVQPAAPSVETTTPKVTEQEIAIPDTPAKETEETTPNPVPLKVSVDPVVEPAIEDLKTEPESLSTDKPEDEVSNVKLISEPTAENASTQDTEIVTPVKPKVVVPEVTRSVDPAENIKATPAPNKSEATKKTEDTATGDRLFSEQSTVNSLQPVEPVKNIEAPPIPNTEAKTKKADTNTGDRLPEQVSNKPDIKPQPQTSPQKVEPVKVQPVTKASQLDSLETVEVAEVLEASEDSTINLDTDRSNIIEVTTTEINITTEVTKLEQPEDNSDPQEK